MDDHQAYTWVSESDSENYDLQNYENILMLIENFQMNYDDFGRWLEIQMQFILISC